VAISLYVDIHSHIIPGLDDGARDYNETMDILRMASENGTVHIIATPHFISETIKNDSGLIHEKTVELQNLANSEEFSISIHTGAEVFLSPDIPELLDKGVICTLNDSSYILVELPMSGLPVYTNDILYNLQLKGLIPIIAHPERNRDISRNPDILAKMVKRGILAQVNAGSITGLFGREVRNTTMKLIRSGLIQFVASDTHTCRGRSPKLAKAADIVKRKFGQEMAESLFYKNGMAVLKNETIPITVRKEGTGFMRLFERRVKWHED